MRWTDKSPEKYLKKVWKPYDGMRLSESKSQAPFVTERSEGAPG